MAVFIWLPVKDSAFTYTMGTNNHGWRYLSPEDGNISSPGVPWSTIGNGDTVKIVGHAYASSSGHVCWESGQGDDGYTTWSYDELAFEFASHFPRGVTRPRMDINLQFCWSAEGGLSKTYMLYKGVSSKGEPPNTKLLALQRTDSLIKKFAAALRHMGFEGSRVTGFYGEVLNNHDFQCTVVEKVSRQQYVSGNHPHAPNITPYALNRNMENGPQGWHFKSSNNQKYFATITQASRTILI